MEAGGTNGRQGLNPTSCSISSGDHGSGRPVGLDRLLDVEPIDPLGIPADLDLVELTGLILRDTRPADSMAQ
jgi:hypothetical protein